MTIVGLKELSQNTGKIAKRAAQGERFVVMNRSTPMFDITPHSGNSEIDLKASSHHVTKFVKKHQKAFDELSQK